jgi:carboxypeptidase C (cathepsin A)
VKRVTELTWLLSLPSIAAAHLKREHKLSTQAMAPVIACTRGDYASTSRRKPSSAASIFPSW